MLRVMLQYISIALCYITGKIDIIINNEKFQMFKKHRCFGFITLLHCGRKPLEYAIQMEALVCAIIL